MTRIDYLRLRRELLSGAGANASELAAALQQADRNQTALQDDLARLRETLEKSSGVLAAALANDVHAELARLRDALEESVRLQSHYAKLLNMHDGGHRIGFANADAWLERLAELRERKAHG